MGLWLLATLGAVAKATGATAGPELPVVATGPVEATKVGPVVVAAGATTLAVAAAGLGAIAVAATAVGRLHHLHLPLQLFGVARVLR